MPAPAAHSEYRPVRGFTLIELLVVIAIIAILASITIPSLSRVRESGRVAFCGNSLGQIGKALQMYADANRDRLPPMFGDANAASWAARIAEYVGGDTNIFTCPSDPYGAVPGKDRSYAANGHAAPGAYRFPFSDGDATQPMRMSDLDAHSGDIILVSEWMGNPTYAAGGPRGSMDNDFFASLDLHPSTAHRSAAGGNYLMGSMSVRYITTAVVKDPPEGNPRNLWTVVPPP